MLRASSLLLVVLASSVASAAEQCVQQCVSPDEIVDTSLLDEALSAMKQSFPAENFNKQTIWQLESSLEEVVAFQESDLDYYKNQIIQFCVDLQSEDAEIVRSVAVDPNTRVNGPTDEQIKRREKIKGLISYCAMEGAGFQRNKKYWIEYDRFNTRALNLKSRLDERISRCRFDARCRDGDPVG